MEGTELSAVAAAVAEILLEGDEAQRVILEGVSGADIDASRSGTMHTPLFEEEPSETVSFFILYELDAGPCLW